ncbi:MULTISPECIES: hypothetical protein [unclassified Bizionia]|nr:hypothetical protein [Bizionia sp. M204]UPS92833.1 hypothetical protein GMA17_14360 [Bizionia sp. M204]
MKSLLLNAASILIPGRKAKIIIVGLQLGFLVYKVLEQKDENKHIETRN